ncbi:hypothetical protein D3C80_1593570 [compost metagenome]
MNWTHTTACNHPSQPRTDERTDYQAYPEPALKRREEGHMLSDVIDQDDRKWLLLAGNHRFRRHPAEHLLMFLPLPHIAV